MDNSEYSPTINVSLNICERPLLFLLSPVTKLAKLPQGVLDDGNKDNATLETRVLAFRLVRYVQLLVDVIDSSCRVSLLVLESYQACIGLTDGASLDGCEGAVRASST